MSAAVSDALENAVDTEGGSRRATATSGAPAVRARSRTDLRILLVEDDPLFAEVVMRFIEHVERPRMFIEHVPTLAAALECLTVGGFDVVLLDLTLPDSTAEMTCERLLANAPDLPVVILSGHASEHLALEALQAGAQDYVVKGDLSLALLMRVVHHAIERKRLQLSLVERETIYRLITENAHDLIAVLDREGRRIYRSPSYRRLLGAADDGEGADSMANVHPDDLDRVRRIFQETVASGVGQRTEYQFVCPASGVRHIESQGSVIKDETGRVAKVIVVSRDVTERRHAEGSLKESEQRYKHLLGSVTDYIYTVELDGRGEPVAARHNRSCVALTGYTAEEFHERPGLGMGMVLPEDRQAVEAMLAGARAGRVTQPIEHRIRHKDGTVRWVRATTVPHRDGSGRVISYDGLITDVTERREADDRLRHSEALYQSLVGNLPQCIMRKDCAGRFIFVNQRFAEMLHAPAEEILGKSDYDFYPTAMAEKFQADDQRVMASGEMFETIEENLTANGVLHDVQVLKIPVRDPAGVVSGVQCVFWDVTAARRAQNEIERRDELLQAIMDHTPAVIYMKDREGRYLYVNREFEKLFGLKRERIVSKTDYQVFPPEVARRFQENDRQILAAGAPRTLDEQAPHPDGLHDYLSVKFPVRDAGDHAYAICGISTDISDRKRFEKELHQRNRELQAALAELSEAKMHLIQTEKLRAVGTLAAGVAHEVKNPLQAILFSVSGLKGSLANLDERNVERLQTMREAVERADKIVRDLLDFARPNPLKIAAVDINDLLRDVLQFMKYPLRDAHIVVTVRFDRYAPVLMLDRQKMQQVFINIITNAVHAMDAQAGRERRLAIAVATEVHDDGIRLPRGLGDTTCWLPGDELVVVNITDDGPGIPPALLPQIFDPFFTTKGPGKGTGLGLHVVQNIVALHGGTIEITNRPEGGVRARLTLNPKKGRLSHEKVPSPDRR